MDDLTEGVGESSSPPRSFGGYDVRTDVYNRLVESGHEETVSNPEFREELEAHFNRFPASYGLDVNVDRPEDVLLHRRLLALAKDPEKRPVFHVRLLESVCTKADSHGDNQRVDTSSLEQALPSDKRPVNCLVDFEPCSKLEDLILDVRKNFSSTDERSLTDNIPRRLDLGHTLIHEVTFSTIDKPKLLSQLSALLSDIGLNIREAHVFSTTDGYSLDVFVVDGWNDKDVDGLYKALEEAIGRSEGSWSGSSHLQAAIDWELSHLQSAVHWEIERRLLKTWEKVASGSCGDLYRGTYRGQDVAIKTLRSEHLTDAIEKEFAQEVAILRQVQHRNVIRFVGACTNSPNLCIVTEYMPGGSLYEYLHKNRNDLKLAQLVKFAIDVCKGMEYLHQNDIIHRDLKTANLLIDAQNVVKVADFGISRFQNHRGVMTAETGTYRWMAPEIMNHQPYDQKADVFSFAIVLWELLTAKIPYDDMTPLQAAMGVRQGLRPTLPEDAHPKLLQLMQRCWEEIPSKRPSFSEITCELETVLLEIEKQEK